MPTGGLRLSYVDDVPDRGLLPHLRLLNLPVDCEGNFQALLFLY